MVSPTTYVAFYKGKGTLADKLIRLWTRSRYSHAELVVDGMWYSTSPREMVVRRRQINFKSSSWDLIPVKVDIGAVEDFYKKTEGQGYDWVGIVFNEVLPFRLQKKDKWYCSEWVATAIGLCNPSMSPQKLYESLVNLDE